MLKYFKDLFNSPVENSNQNLSPDSTADFSKKKLHLATCALFLEVAHADDKFHTDEREKIISLMNDMFQLNDEEIEELIKQSDEIVKDSVSIYEFTDVVNKYFNSEEKYEVIKNLWRLILVDEKVNKYEEHFVRTISNNFHLEHKDMIAAKLEVKEELGL